MIIFDAAMTNSEKVEYGLNGFYFGINGEHSWYDISKAIGKAMVKHGLSKSDEPTPFTEEELVKYYGSLVRIFPPFPSYVTSLTTLLGRAFSTIWVKLSWSCKSLQVYWLESEVDVRGHARQYRRSG